MPRASEPLCGVVLALLLAAPAAAVPERVVSINLCTDQLAMLLAAPGQLISVSHLARDPRSSAMAAEAAAFPANGGRAEDVYLLAPDLVLAGSFTTPASVAMLRRLGLRVETFPHASRLADVGDQLRRMGTLLGREAEAEALAARFEATLAALSAEEATAKGTDQPPEAATLDPTGAPAPATLSPGEDPGAAPEAATAAPRPPRAALYGANGWSSGRATLPGEVLAAAGFANVAAELGLETGGFLPLETLVLAAPDLVVTGRPFPGASRAEAVTGHPALVRSAPAGLALTDRDWVCGLPHVLNAIEAMIALRAGPPPAAAAPEITARSPPLPAGASPRAEPAR